MHVSLLCDVRVQTLYALCIGKRCQCADIHDLCLSAVEHGRAVHSRNQTNLCMKRTNLCQLAAIRTLVILENHLANRLFLVLIYRIAKLRKVRIVSFEGSLESFCNLSDCSLAGLLVIREDRLLHLLLRNNLLDILEHLLRNRHGDVLLLGLADLALDEAVELNELLVNRICLVDIGNHICLRNLIGTCLNHQDAIRRGGNRQAKITLVPLLLAGVDDHLAVYKSHLRCRTGTGKRNIRNGCCQRCAHHGNQLRTALRIHTHNHALQCHIVAHVLREERTHRTVDHTTRQNGVVTCLSLSFFEAAGNLADCIELLAVFYGQWEEINAIARCSRLGCCAQYGCIAIVHERAAICLLAESSDIHSQRSACQLHGIGCVGFLLLYIVIHSFSCSSFRGSFVPGLQHVYTLKATPGRLVTRPKRRLPFSFAKNYFLMPSLSISARYFSRSVFLR